MARARSAGAHECRLSPASSRPHSRGDASRGGEEGLPRVARLLPQRPCTPRASGSLGAAGTQRSWRARRGREEVHGCTKHARVSWTTHPEQAARHATLHHAIVPPSTAPTPTIDEHQVVALKLLLLPRVQAEYFVARRTHDNLPAAKSGFKLAKVHRSGAAAVPASIAVAQSGSGKAACMGCVLPPAELQVGAAPMPARIARAALAWRSVRHLSSPRGRRPACSCVGSGRGSWVGPGHLKSLRTLHRTCSQGLCNRGQAASGQHAPLPALTRSTRGGRTGAPSAPPPPPGRPASAPEGCPPASAAAGLQAERGAGRRGAWGTRGERAPGWGAAGTEGTAGGKVGAPGRCRYRHRLKGWKPYATNRAAPSSCSRSSSGAASQKQGTGQLATSLWMRARLRPRHARRWGAAPAAAVPQAAAGAMGDTALAPQPRLRGPGSLKALPRGPAASCRALDATQPLAKASDRLAG